ncbi:MAG: hypothetical protein OEU32_09110, partial [Acidimicrobiia bacterium]|nr:hypothetical protein [Acidimicrobiia bacterium]
LIGSEAAVLGGPRQGSQLAMIGASGLIVAAVLISVAMPLRSLPFGSLDDDGTYHWGPFSTTDHSFVATWAAWNNEGYEAKIGDETGGGWDEYRGIIETMTAVGAERGCGRAMWEADNDLDRYGSPMALALLPYWTNGCIASMEGLYFESSATTPFHFVNQVELSESPAPALRGIEYGGFDISSGLDHLRLFGVDYYLAQSPTAVTAARAEPGLVEVETAEPWVVFEVDGSTLVEGVGYQPVVVEGVGDGEEWRDLALLPYLGVTDHRALIAADGPDEWTRVGKDAVEVGVGAIATESVVVSDIDMGTDSLSFDVDRLGVPVLVKVSWFPSWQARGADGPYRVAPNLMVVIPTSERVELRFVDRPIDIAARITTAVGLAALVLLRRRPIELTPLDRPTCLES